MHDSKQNCFFPHKFSFNSITFRQSKFKPNNISIHSKQIDFHLIPYAQKINSVKSIPIQQQIKSYSQGHQRKQATNNMAKQKEKIKKHILKQCFNSFIACLQTMVKTLDLIWSRLTEMYYYKSNSFAEKKVFDLTINQSLQKIKKISPSESINTDFELLHKATVQLNQQTLNFGSKLSLHKSSRKCTIYSKMPQGLGISQE